MCASLFAGVDMDAANVLYSLAYGVPTLAVVLVCGLIGHRFRAWRGLAVGAAIPTALLCFGRASQYAESEAGPAGATQAGAITALLTALAAPTICFGMLFLAERAAARNLRDEGKWPTVTATVTAIIICTAVSLGATALFYGQLFPLDELNKALQYWALLGLGTWWTVSSQAQSTQQKG
jgi:hypothetical protein